VSVVITGVAGFIGSHLAERLLDDGQDVLGFDCFTDYYSPATKESHLSKIAKHPSFRLERVDLAQDDVAGSLRVATHVYHLAGQPGVRASWGAGFDGYVRNNIIATQRVVEALRDSSTRLVFASSSSVYGAADVYPTPEDSIPRPSSPYGVTKLCAEQLVMAYRRSFGLDARCVRYFTVYGPRQRPDMAFSKFIAAANKHEAIEVFGDGRQTRDFTFVSDAVDGTIRAGAVDDPREAIFNLGGGSRVTLEEVLEILARVVGHPLNIERGRAQPGDVRDTGADLTRARNILGWQPRIGLEEGLRAQVAGSDT
jgi:UDP-glucuronate 4-epimerase